MPPKKKQDAGSKKAQEKAKQKIVEASLCQIPFCISLFMLPVHGAADGEEER